MINKMKITKNTENISPIDVKNIENISPIDAIQTNLAPLYQQIAKHPLIPRLGELAVLKLFMSQHVFIVWDFVNLIKTLYSRLTHTQLPWLPSENPSAVRLLYEILIEEETDLDPNSNRQYCSHLSLYQQAMRACGADQRPFNTMIRLLEQNKPWETALKEAAVFPSTYQFVRQTLITCEQAPLPSLAAYFVFGREAMIPDLFKPWLAALKQQKEQKAVAPLIYYLERHIELDSDAHFPKAVEMLTKLCAGNQQHWASVQQAAQNALYARLQFLEGMLLSLEV